MNFSICLLIIVEKITIRMKKNINDESKFDDNNKSKNDKKLTLSF